MSTDIGAELVDCYYDKRVEAEIKAMPWLTPRQLALFACAAAWRVREALPEYESRRSWPDLLQAAEGYARTGASLLPFLKQLTRMARWAQENYLGSNDYRWPAWKAVCEAGYAAARSRAVEAGGREDLGQLLAPITRAPWEAAWACSRYAQQAAAEYGGIRGRPERLKAEAEAQLALLRCVAGPRVTVGNELALDLRPALPASVLAFEDRLPGRLAHRYTHCFEAEDLLPILADALEEAGCEDGVMLGHLRGPGPHARDCWAVCRLLPGGEA